MIVQQCLLTGRRLDLELDCGVVRLVNAKSGGRSEPSSMRSRWPKPSTRVDECSLLNRRQLVESGDQVEDVLRTHRDARVEARTREVTDRPAAPVTSRGGGGLCVVPAAIGPTRSGPLALRALTGRPYLYAWPIASVCGSNTNISGTPAPSGRPGREPRATSHAS